MAEIYTRAVVPDELLQKWLQHQRDFDVQNPGCHFEVLADAPEMSVGDIMMKLVVEPDLPVKAFFRWGG